MVANAMGENRDQSKAEALRWEKPIPQTDKSSTYGSKRAD